MNRHKFKEDLKNYNKIKQELEEKLKKKRVSESRSMLSNKFDRSKFETEISRKTHEMDKKTQLLDKIKHEDIKAQMRKMKMYAERVKKVTKISVSSEKRKEIQDLILNQQIPAKDKVPKIKRKTGGYYSIKFKKPAQKSLANVNSLGEDNFYSELGTSKKERIEQNDSIDSKNYVPPITYHRNKDNTMNLDLGDTDIRIKKNKIQPAYHRTYLNTTDKHNVLRSSTPDYNFKASKYKSKLWDNKFSVEDIGNNTAQLSESKTPMADIKVDHYLQKSMELKNRIRMKEMALGKRSQSLISRDAEEMSDMLIDSILYKVNALKQM